MKPKVSVLMITYNQQEYIGQAIQSVLMQKTDFAFELVIGEDCSIDGTLEICQTYQQKHLGQIRLLTHENNLGMTRNFLSTLQQCHGEYLAILEGDDFWIDPLKLQKQADFLDTHPDFALVFTRTEFFFQDTDHPDYEMPQPGQGPYTLENLLKSNFIPTCSVMYRQGTITSLPDWLSRLEMLDWPLHVLHAERGKIGFLDEKTAIYRIHSASAYSSRKITQNYISVLKFYDVINGHLGRTYRKAIHGYQMIICKEMARLSEEKGERVDHFRYKILAFWHQLRAALG
jgi:glycosyltransferase involved in cell wall biosynthesis